MSSDDDLEREATEREAALTGRPAYVVRANRAVPDRLIRDLVNDFRRGPAAPSSMATRPGHSKPDEPDRPRTGWVDPAPLQSPPGIEHVDALCDAQDRRDRAVAVQQKRENDWIEAQLDRRNPHKAKTEYNVLGRFDNETPSFHREKDE
jgi:hypothetical protein